ncbi:hypothetical protein PZH37_15510 [[Eubacterium] siraeum]|nr:hypothetical protein [[Eubacterium] siraeum]
MSTKMVGETLEQHCLKSALFPLPKKYGQMHRRYALPYIRPHRTDLLYSCLR